jgi:N utilization substance protein A
LVAESIALQPAEVEEVILCQMLGRAIVLVREDQLSLAIGRRGQNVRLASKLCVWDIEIMTREELDESIERAVAGFSALEGVDESLSEKLVGEGFLSYDDLSVIEPDALMEMGELSEEQSTAIIDQADAKAKEAEQAAALERRRQREQDRIDAATAAAEALEAAERQAQELAAGGPAEIVVAETIIVEADAAEMDAGETDAVESSDATPLGSSEEAAAVPPTPAEG